MENNVIGNCGKHSGNNMVNCPMCAMEKPLINPKQGFFSKDKNWNDLDFKKSLEEANKKMKKDDFKEQKNIIKLEVAFFPSKVFTEEEVVLKLINALRELDEDGTSVIFPE